MDVPELSAVLKDAREGDSSAWETLYRRTYRPVFGLCLNMLRLKEAAEDATHEVFIKVQRSIDTYDGSIPFLNWMFSIASHHCIDLLRRRQRDQRWISDGEIEPEILPDAAPSPLTAVLVQDQAERVRSAIARLPNKYRVPLVMQYYGDLGYDEIARKMHLNRNTVATLIFRAKQELRQMLSKERTEASS